MYVCTAAERGYALEAWRLLDSGNDIIPDEARSARVVCSGGQKKELRKVLRVQTPIKFESGRNNFPSGASFNILSHSMNGLTIALLQLQL